MEENENSDKENGSAAQAPPRIWKPYEFIESHGLGFTLGNAVLHICIASKSNTDAVHHNLNAAMWYIDRCILHCKNGYHIQSPRITTIPVDKFCELSQIPMELQQALEQIISFSSMGGRDYYCHHVILVQAKNFITKYISSQP